MPIPILPAAQQQIDNSQRRFQELQAELNRIQASLRMSDQLYQFLSQFLGNASLLTLGCQNLLVSLRRAP